MMRGTDTSTKQECLASVPVELYAEAKRAVSVDPSELDFEQDRRDWESLSHEMRLPILAYLAVFARGTAVDLEQSSRLLPLVLERNEVDELQCFTTLLAEKSRFHDFFETVIADVTGMRGSPERFFFFIYTYFMSTWLPETVDQALRRQNDKSLIRAFFAISAATEGVLALSGYSIVSKTLERLDAMPVLREQVRYQSERTASHVAFGFHIIHQLMGEDPANEQAIESLVDSAFGPSVGTVRDLFADYATSAVPATEAVTITLQHLAQVDARLQALLQPTGISHHDLARQNTVCAS